MFTKKGIDRRSLPRSSKQKILHKMTIKQLRKWKSPAQRKKITIQYVPAITNIAVHHKINLNKVSGGKYSKLKTEAEWQMTYVPGSGRQTLLQPFGRYSLVGRYPSSLSSHGWPPNSATLSFSTTDSIDLSFNNTQRKVCAINRIPTTYWNYQLRSRSTMWKMPIIGST